MAIRVLIFYITKTSGHRKAAQAIGLALKDRFEEVKITSLDCFNYTNPILSKLIYKSYSSLLKTKPEVWEYLYDNPNIVEKVQKFKEIIHKFNSEKLRSIIKKYTPDVIVCTQAFPAGLVADYKNSNFDNIPLVAVLTDYYPHSFWLYPEIDIYIVACEEAKQRLMNEGVSAEKIKNYGIPIKQEFFIKKDKQSLSQKFGLDKDLPIILIMGGSQGVGPLKKIVFSIDQLPLDFQIIITTGFNDNLNKYLNRKRESFNHRLQVFGYVDNIDEMMQVSDLLITKPGGLTTAEAISKELPMVIFNPIPGQEKNNSKFLLDRGVALKADNPKEISILVRKLLTNQDKYGQMRKLLKENSYFNPALKTAELIYNLAYSSSHPA